MINYETIKNFDNMTEEEMIDFLDDNQIDIVSLYQLDNNTMVSRSDSEEDVRQIFEHSPVFEEQDWKYLCLKLSSRLLTQQKLSEMLQEMLVSRLGQQEANVLYSNLTTQYQQTIKRLQAPVDEKIMAEIDDLYDL